MRAAPPPAPAAPATIHPRHFSSSGVSHVESLSHAEKSPPRHPFISMHGSTLDCQRLSLRIRPLENIGIIAAHLTEIIVLAVYPRRTRQVLARFMERLSEGVRRLRNKDGSERQDRLSVDSRPPAGRRPVLRACIGAFQEVGSCRTFWLRGRCRHLERASSERASVLDGHSSPGRRRWNDAVIGVAVREGVCDRRKASRRTSAVVG